MKGKIIFIVVLLIFTLLSTQVFSIDCEQYCRNKCKKNPDCLESSAYQIGTECNCSLKLKGANNVEPITVALISVGIIIFITTLVILHDKRFFKSTHEGLIISGMLMMILGFLSIFTTLPIRLIYYFSSAQDELFTLHEGYKICNSWIGTLGAIIEPQEVLNFCRQINMFFYLSSIILILGIIFIIIGIVKKK